MVLSEERLSTCQGQSILGAEEEEEAVVRKTIERQILRRQGRRKETKKTEGHCQGAPRKVATM